MEKRKILIIDDEPAFTEMVKLNLEATGRYEVKSENEGMHAVEAALMYRPDLILLDIVMPGVEGPDIVCKIREHDAIQGTPVVFLTATVRKEEMDDTGKIGGHIFLAKPTTIDELIDCIETQLNPPESE